MDTAHRRAPLQMARLLLAPDPRERIPQISSAEAMPTRFSTGLTMPSSLARPETTCATSAFSLLSQKPDRRFTILWARGPATGSQSSLAARSSLSPTAQSASAADPDPAFPRVLLLAPLRLR